MVLFFVLEVTLRGVVSGSSEVVVMTQVQGGAVASPGTGSCSPSAL